MHVIKSKMSDKFITPDGNIGSFEEAAQFSDKSVAKQAMEYWGLGETCRVRRVIGGKNAN